MYVMLYYWVNRAKQRNSGRGQVSTHPRKHGPLTIEFKPEQQRVIVLAIQSGAYHNSDEVIATALSMLSEDIEDGAVSEARSLEPRFTLAEVEAELRALGKIDVTGYLVTEAREKRRMQP